MELFIFSSLIQLSGERSSKRTFLRPIKVHCRRYSAPSHTHRVAGVMQGFENLWMRENKRSVRRNLNYNPVTLMCIIMQMQRCVSDGNRCGLWGGGVGVSVTANLN